MDSTELRRVLVVVTVTGLAFGMTYPYVPILAGQLGANALMAGFVSGINVPAMLIVDGFGTRFVPRLDARSALAASLVSFGIGSAIAAASDSLFVLICSRFFEGAGIAVFMSAGIHLVTRETPAHERGRAIGRFNACWFLGAASGPLIGGALSGLAEGTAGLRVTFAACAAVSFASALLIRFVLAPHPSPGRPHLTMPPVRALRGDSRLGRAVLLGGQSEAVRDGFMMVVIPLAATAAGLTDAAIGLVLTMLALADVVSMHLSGRAADRYGRVRPLVVTLVVAAGVSLTGMRADDPVSFLILGLALGATLGTAWVVPPTMVLDLATDREAAVAAYRICADIGLFVGTFGAGALFQLVGPGTAFAGMAVALLAGALLAASIGETRPATSTLPTLEVTP